MFSSWSRKKGKEYTKQKLSSQTPEATLIQSVESPSPDSKKRRKSQSKENRTQEKRSSLSDVSASPVKLSEKLVNDQKEEYERKIRVLSQCLEEKAEENISLNEKLTKQKRNTAKLQQTVTSSKDLEVLVKELNVLLGDKEESITELKNELQMKSEEITELNQLTTEFQRRIRALSTCLEQLAQENLEFWTDSSGKEISAQKVDTTTEEHQTKEIEAQHEENVGTLPKNSIPVNVKLVELTLRQDLERSEEQNELLQQSLTETKEKLENIENSIAESEQKFAKLKSKCMDAMNQRNALEESNELYEQKLSSLESELTDSLHQEGIRRQEAEYIASKLKKKVAELQFLLDERDEGSDSSYYSEDDDF